MKKSRSYHHKVPPFDSPIRTYSPSTGYRLGSYPGPATGLGSAAGVGISNQGGVDRAVFSGGLGLDLWCRRLSVFSFPRARVLDRRGLPAGLDLAFLLDRRGLPAGLDLAFLLDRRGLPAGLDLAFLLDRRGLPAGLDRVPALAQILLPAGGLGVARILSSLPARAVWAGTRQRQPGVAARHGGEPGSLRGAVPCGVDGDDAGC